MMTGDEHLWIVGRGGLLGRALERSCPDRAQFDHEPIHWDRTDVLDSIRALAVRFVARAHDNWSVFWSAGAGIIGTSNSALQHETAALNALLEGLRSAQHHGRLVLASSAGGVYGGVDQIPITESAEPRPLSDYGRNKLKQEQLVAVWASETGNRALVARIANLYGPGQRLSKPQGLVSQICRATILRQPVSVYVSLDTLRDYVYVDDCASTLLRASDRLDTEPTGTLVTKLLASGTCVSIGHLLGETSRVLDRRPTVVMASSSNSALHATRLSFRSTVWTQLDRPPTPLAVGIRRTADDIISQVGRGELLAAPSAA